jgi:signal peptidase I
VTIREPQEELFRSDPVDLTRDVPAQAAATSPVERRTPKTRSHTPARKTDYRLRGLDLDAHGLAEVQPRHVRKRHPSRRSRRRRLFVQWVAVLAMLAATVVVLRSYVVQPYSVRSTSMVPNLQPGTDVLVVRPKLLTGSIKTGDIVVFHRPANLSCKISGDSSQELIKRVIGLPGQRIWSADNRIWIDGQPLKESGWYNAPYGELGPTQITPMTVPAGSYFVMGDNRTDPCDSRAFGAIAASSLVGKAVVTTTRGGHPYVHVL